MHIIIYSYTITPRLKFIFNFIFRDILKVEVEFTNDATYFLNSVHIKISYTTKPLANELFFKSTKLLFNKKIEPINLETVKFGDYLVPFEVQESALPFDVFASSFFIISRYEEYLNKEKSISSFNAHKSYQYKWKVLNRPIIDEWALLIKNKILKKYPTFKFIDKKFFHQNTINFSLKADIPKGFILKSKFILSSILSKKQQYLNNLFDDFIGMGVNAEAVMNTLNSITNQNDTLYFVSFPNDLNHANTFTNSVKLLKNKTVGLLSPCLPNTEKTNILKLEIEKLKTIQKNQINISSQQLAFLKIPSCYLHLLSSGITTDYSMGYVDNLGFRAGTCTPFYWYDLQLDKITALHVKSYCISDIALQKLSIDDAKIEIKEYIDAVQLVHGNFYSTWQLKSLAENSKFKKWRSVFNNMMKYTNN